MIKKLLFGLFLFQCFLFGSQLGVTVDALNDGTWLFFPHGASLFVHSIFVYFNYLMYKGRNEN